MRSYHHTSVERPRDPSLWAQAPHPIAPATLTGKEFDLRIGETR